MNFHAFMSENFIPVNLFIVIVNINFIIIKDQNLIVNNLGFDINFAITEHSYSKFHNFPMFLSNVFIQIAIISIIIILFFLILVLKLIIDSLCHYFQQQLLFEKNRRCQCLI